MNSTLLHLSLVDGLGPVYLNRLIENLNYDQLDRVYDYTLSDFIERCRIPHALAQKVMQGLKDTSHLKQELELIDKHAIRICTIADADYPPSLRLIHMPPPVLYIKGTLPANVKGLAIVGSRNAQSYVHRALKMIIPPLCQQGWQIVSGGALGADTFAHELTLAHGGITHAVLGAGLLHLYPVSNKKLFAKILESGGALITTFAMNELPHPGNFPARNRVIAGLSKGCLIAQAALKSGARITANFALEQSKEIFVIPGPIDIPDNEGGHALIKQGAQLVTSAEDILQEFGEFKTLTQKIIPSDIYEENQPNMSAGDEILLLCTFPVSTEHLVESTNLSLFDLQVRLFDLQIEGKITQDLSGLWCRV